MNDFRNNRNKFNNHNDNNWGRSRKRKRRRNKKGNELSEDQIKFITIIILVVAAVVILRWIDAVIGLQKLAVYIALVFLLSIINLFLKIRKSRSNSNIKKNRKILLQSLFGFGFLALIVLFLDINFGLVESILIFGGIVITFILLLSILILLFRPLKPYVDNFFSLFIGGEIEKDRWHKGERIAIPAKTKELVIGRANNRCQHYEKDEYDRCSEKLSISGIFSGNIHHIDNDPSNNDEFNLIALCATHHNKWTILLRQIWKKKIDEFEFYEETLRSFAINNPSFSFSSYSNSNNNFTPEEIHEAYLTLGISENSSNSDIEEAYSRLVKKYHPDIYPGGDEAMVRINSAIQILRKIK